MMRALHGTRRAWLAGCVLSLLASAAASDGTLVVAGGAVRAENEAVFRAFISALPDPDGKVVVISAASGSPVGSARHFVETLGDYGVTADRVVPIELAITDDDETDFDERQWADNASDTNEIAKLAGAAGVWFTGGDQRRIAEALLDDAGRSTLMLDAIRGLHAEGAVIGGTSAGAAIMSNPMITGGEPIVALLGGSIDGEPLTMDTGLGFFAPGLVDQHFDARARLGRVAVALGVFNKDRRFAIGVDEDTAFTYSPEDAQVSVIGVGNVTLVDGRNATWRRIGESIAIDGLTISVLSPGDEISLADGSYRPAAYLKPTVGNEYNDHEAIAGGGIAMPSVALSRMLGEELLDNRSADEVERVSVVASSEETSIGVLFRFRQTEASLGFWGRDEDGRSRYSAIGVSFDVVPLKVTIKRIESPDS